MQNTDLGPEANWGCLECKGKPLSCVHCIRAKEHLEAKLSLEKKEKQKVEILENPHECKVNRWGWCHICADYSWDKSKWEKNKEKKSKDGTISIRCFYCGGHGWGYYRTLSQGCETTPFNFTCEECLPNDSSRDSELYQIRFLEIIRCITCHECIRFPAKYRNRFKRIKEIWGLKCKNCKNKETSK